MEGLCRPQFEESGDDSKKLEEHLDQAKVGIFSPLSCDGLKVISKYLGCINVPLNKLLLRSFLSSFLRVNIFLAIFKNIFYYTEEAKNTIYSPVSYRNETS